jgi:outer membrane protein OmpA-like peptidoglycan-associated protein
MRKILIAVPVVLLAVGGSTACAAKKFVRTSVGEVNDKVDSLGKSVEETQERTRRNEGRIAEVDQRAQSASNAAADANAAAGAAATRADTAAGIADAIDKTSRRLVYEVVLSENQGNFRSAQTTLPDGARQKIDEMVSRLKEDPKNIYIEIEGHTDNVGDTEINKRIGLERAEAVKRYLYEQYQIPLHKMNVISYGKEKPMAPNETKTGRALNRRVVIKVLA